MPDDPEIEAERAFLADARTALARMHADVITTETPLNDGEDTDEIWHNTVYQLTRTRRAAALVDLPSIPLFFGRLDYPSGAVFADSTRASDTDARAPDADRVYIGRRHVHDAGGRPMVIDWRAPISTAFYRATHNDPQGVQLRRRYGFSDAAELTAYEDELLAGSAGADTAAAQESAIVTAEIERARSGPMRDIVATIQPEQDDLVRAPLHPTICIQGAPGTGKTAVGLHRLAYLLYTERARLGRGGVAVVGPNRSFLTYIRHVLPALGEVDVSQATIEELIGRRAVGASEGPSTARIKGDARMAAVLHRALGLHTTNAAEEGLVYVDGSYRHRVASTMIDKTVAALRGTMRYGPGRTALAQRLAHFILLQMERSGGSPDDRMQDAVARSKPVKKILDRVWPKLAPEPVLFRLLSDPDFLADAAQGQLTPQEQALLHWLKPYRSWKSAKWSAADAVLLDELADLIDRTPSLSHIVVDEAQDLSPMQCRALARRCGTGSLTVLGDLAQGTSPWAADDWPTLLAHLGQPDARLAVLNQGFRVPAQILDYAARLLPQIAPGLATPTSVRRATGALQITSTTQTGLLDAVLRACHRALTGEGSVGLIAADTQIAAIHQRLLTNGLAAAVLGQTEDALETSRLVCVPATLAKGLEFDAVVVAEPASILAAEPRGPHRLYVVLTRAVTSLHIVHAEPLPAPLRT